MTKLQILESLDAKVTQLSGAFRSACASGRHLEANDLLAELKFACRQLQDALMRR